MCTVVLSLLQLQQIYCQYETMLNTCSKMSHLHFWRKMSWMHMETSESRTGSGAVCKRRDLKVYVGLTTTSVCGFMRTRCLWRQLPVCGGRLVVCRLWLRRKKSLKSLSQSILGEWAARWMEIKGGSLFRGDINRIFFPFMWDVCWLLALLVVPGVAFVVPGVILLPSNWHSVPVLLNLNDNINYWGYHQHDTLIPLSINKPPEQREQLRSAHENTPLYYKVKEHQRTEAESSSSK